MSSEKINSKRAIGLAVGAVFFLLLLVYGYGYWKSKKLQNPDRTALIINGEMSGWVEATFTFIMDRVDHSIWVKLREPIMPVFALGFECQSVEIYPALLSTGNYENVGGLFYESVETIRILYDDDERDVLSEIGSFPNCKYLWIQSCPRLGQEQLLAIMEKFPQLETLSIETREIDWSPDADTQLDSLKEVFLALRKMDGVSPIQPRTTTVRNLPEWFPALQSLHFYNEGEHIQATSWESLITTISRKEIPNALLRKEAQLERIVDWATRANETRTVKPPTSDPFRIDPIFEGTPATEVTDGTFLKVAVEDKSGERFLRKYPKMQELTFYQSKISVEFLRDLREKGALRSVRLSGALTEGPALHRIPPILISPYAEEIKKANQGETIVEWEELDDVRGLVERLRKEVE